MQQVIKALLAGSLLFLLPSGPALAGKSRDPAQPNSSTGEVAMADDNGIDKEVAAWESLNPGYHARTPLPYSGKAMYYNPGVMEEVLDYRQNARQVSQCPECIGYVALLRAGDLDRTVWLRRPGHLDEGPFWVIDVAARRHVGLLLQRSWAVDVDFQTAMRWRMNRPIAVVVLEKPSPEALLGSCTLPLHWSADPVPAENFYPLPSSSLVTGVNDGDGRLAERSLDVERHNRDWTVFSSGGSVCFGSTSLCPVKRIPNPFAAQKSQGRSQVQ